MNPICHATIALLLCAIPAYAHADQAAPAPFSAATDAPVRSAALPIYGDANPGKPSDEIEMQVPGGGTGLRNVTYPTLTPVLPPKGKANGTAVIVAPGGGFLILSMENEGWRIANALAERGVTAFVLKYRLKRPEGDEKAWMQSFMKVFVPTRPGGKTLDIHSAEATQDALAALKLIRARSSEWKIDPKRVGMMGFSAGAITTLDAILQAPVDDPLAAPPDFVGYIYGPMAAVAVPPNAPPMYAALAVDDPLFGNGDFSLVSAWHMARKPVELHAYQTGGHGFGSGKPGTTTMSMMPGFLAWMEMRGLLAKRPDQ